MMKHDETSSAYIPLRIRDIIQETLSPNTWGRPLASSLTRENSNLLKELDKAQSLLSQSRKECYNLGVKYITISEKARRPHSIATRIIKRQKGKRHACTFAILLCNNVSG